MPESGHEALIPSLTNHRLPICDRIEANRSAPTEAAAIYRQNRQEKLRILEEAAQKATGVNLRELRASLARNRKQTEDALAALRSRTAAPQFQPSAAAAPTRRMFSSLKPLAGRVVPLAQPVFAFLNTPSSLNKYETGGSWLWNFSLTPGDAFFQTNIYATSGKDYAVYTFRYLWNNDSNSSMITTIFAGLSFTGSLSASAQKGKAEECWEATVSAELDAELGLGISNLDVGESRTTRITAIKADNGFWGLEDGLADQVYYNLDYSISIDGFLVPANSSLEIDVSVAFRFFWGFDVPVSPADNYVQADFGEDLFPGNRVASNGVAVFASPVTAIV